MKQLKEIKHILALTWGINNRIKILIVLGLMIVYSSALGLVFIPLILKHAIDLMQLDISLNDQSNTTLLIFLLLAYSIGWMLCEALVMLKIGMTFKIIANALTEMIATVVNKFIDLDFVSHSNKKSGEIISIIDRLQAALPQFLDGLFVQILPVVLQIIFAVIIIYNSFNAEYYVVLLSVIIIYLITTVITANKTVDYQTNSNEEQNKFSNHLLDTLQHYDTIKYFNNEAYEKEKIRFFLNKKQQAFITMYKRISFIGVIQIVMVGIGLIFVTIKSGYAVINHKMSLGGFVLLNSYMMQFSLPLSYFGFIVQVVKRSYVDIKEFMQLSDKMVTVNHVTTNVLLDNLDIEFKNVSYHYNNNKKVLDNVSFKIKSGETIAILSKTGSGKSTIVKLLLKLIQPSSGEIFIANINIKEIPQPQLIQLFGIVPQDCSLFNRTIYENIKYGNIQASDQEISNVIDMLNLNHLKDHGELGERSIKISGGEKQRIAIARVLLKNPQICIFDEFTSSLDGATEKDILSIVANLFNGITKIMIAHKLNTIATANKIIFMQNGKIIGFDSHDNLIAKNVEYQKQWTKSN